MTRRPSNHPAICGDNSGEGGNEVICQPLYLILGSTMMPSLRSTFRALLFDFNTLILRSSIMLLF